MPVPKEFMNGFDEGPIYRQHRLKKKKFDKSTVVPDIDKCCFDCKNYHLLHVDKKYGISYQCEKTNYIFKDYWKQTNAKNCDYYHPFEPEESEK